MAFRDARLDPLISIEATGGAGFLPTDIAVADNGYETRTPIGASIRGSWDINYSARREALFARLNTFMLAVARGQAYSFAWKDWRDFECATSESHLEPTDDSPLTWEMWKRYTVGSYSIDYRISLPIVATVSFVGAGSYSASRLGGIITKVSGPDPTGFACEFDKPVRFGVDQIRASVVDKKGDGTFIIEWAAVPIIEVPPFEVTG